MRQFIDVNDAPSFVRAPVAMPGMLVTFACASLIDLDTSACTFWTLEISPCAFALPSALVKGFDTANVALEVTSVARTGTRAVAATHFFVDYLPKGNYVFEYPVRVQHRGVYSTGFAAIQCLYAPEFNSHSESIKLEVK